MAGRGARIYMFGCARLPVDRFGIDGKVETNGGRCAHEFQINLMMIYWVE